MINYYNQSILQLIIVIIKNGNIIGYWNQFDQKIHTKTISIIDEIDILHEYEYVLLHIHVALKHEKEILFPVIIPFNITMGQISDEMRQESKAIYDKLKREHWPVKS